MMTVRLSVSIVVDENDPHIDDDVRLTVARDIRALLRDIGYATNIVVLLDGQPPASAKIGE